MTADVTRRTALTATAAALAGGVLAVPSAHAGITRAPLAPAHPGMRGPGVVTVQRRLNALGYWVGTPNGYYGSQTAQAVMALQKVAGLWRDGDLGPLTLPALQRGVRPAARTRSGRVIEIDLAHQVLLVVDSGRVARIHNTSTGGGYEFTSGGTTHVAVTPPGDFRVWYRWAGVWQDGVLGRMYRPYYFNHDIAVHGLESPTQIGAEPESHGCARVTMAAQDELIRTGALAMRTRVLVY